jgi:KipI family sensor histidine kinase inhibitor
VAARLVPASDRALQVVFDDAITTAAGNDVRALHAWLRDDPPDALVDLHPAYATLLVRYDPLRCDLDTMAREIGRRAGSLAGRRETARRSFEIPVRYGGENGPDLSDVAKAAGLREQDVVAEHAGAAYDVRFIGFLPGFPYLAGLPERLHTVRRESPRTSVPAGSVAIAGAQAGIYPVASPGGWNIIGRTDFLLFDPTRRVPATLAPGDRVRGTGQADLGPVEQDLAGIGPRQPVQDVHERRLAGAILAEQGVDLAGTHVEIDRIVGDDAGVSLRDAAHLERGCANCLGIRCHRGLALPSTIPICGGRVGPSVDPPA